MKRLLSVLMCLGVMGISGILVMAHPGRTDAKGGHYNRKTGEYHYHNGGHASSGGSTSADNISKPVVTPTPQKVYANKVEVSNMPSEIFVGETAVLAGTVYPAEAEDKTISWYSSNPEVAEIDGEGSLTALGAGTTVISAKTSNGVTAEYTLTVNEAPAEEPEAEPETISPPQTKQVEIDEEAVKSKEAEDNEDVQDNVNPGNGGLLAGGIIGGIAVIAVGAVIFIKKRKNKE